MSDTPTTETTTEGTGLAVQQWGVTGTIKELSDMLGVDSKVGTGLINYLRTKEIAVEAGVKKPASGKGKGAKQYTIPKTITITLDAETNPEPGTVPATTTLPGGHTVPVPPTHVAVCAQPPTNPLADPSVQAKANDILSMPEPKPDPNTLPGGTPVQAVLDNMATTKTDEAGAA